MNAEQMSKMADAAQEIADVARKQATDAHYAELRAKPLADRIVYAAYNRCPCGAGLAYDPAFEDEDSVFKGPASGYWDCSAIILGVPDKTVQHTAKLPFMFYEIKSEQQPSVNGATTRLAK